MDVISRLPDCGGLAANAVSALSKNGGCSQDCWDFQSQNVQTWIRLPRHKWPTSTSHNEDPGGSSRTKFVRTPTCGALMERQFEEVPLQLGWKKVSNWECLFVHRKQNRSHRCTWMTLHGWKKRNMAPVWKKLMKHVILMNQLRFLITYIWDALNVNVNWTDYYECATPRLDEDNFKKELESVGESNCLDMFVHGTDW